MVLKQKSSNYEINFQFNNSKLDIYKCPKSNNIFQIQILKMFFKLNNPYIIFIINI